MSTAHLLDSLLPAAPEKAAHPYLVCARYSEEAVLRGRRTRTYNEAGERILRRVRERVPTALKLREPVWLRAVRFPVDPQSGLFFAEPLIALTCGTQRYEQHIVVVEDEGDPSELRFALLVRTGLGFTRPTDEGPLGRVINAANRELRLYQRKLGYRCPDAPLDDRRQLLQLPPAFVVSELQRRADLLLDD